METSDIIGIGICFILTAILIGIINIKTTHRLKGIDDKLDTLIKREQLDK